ncbi:D-beta-hydroxybutyrate dehydrogenase [Taibaiella sp. KBW10]|uniref:3-hydroxybutyrate dehydrogenase n=1 Tax=Taibaiella sp. KBW10 TaxID=2153357 RepID=UPI000F5B3D1E|nr:3-hydroxybutyrate dehydrogenase [Taibaiella sp. KBW10]RQO31510.1 D-beta-hydroxybutyrate dehydrogenase [Taibaiella sp. KBW10]
MSVSQLKTVLITGSTSGIGLAIAKMYAQKGYNIVFNGLEPNGAEIAAEVATAHNIQHLFFPADMSDPAQIKDMAEQSLERFGTVDILVNNAGVQFVAPVEEFPEVKWDAIIDINLNAAFHMTKALWPKMKAQKFGRIINIASAHGLIASPFKSAYVSSKFGIVGFTKTLALEGGEFGITANAVCPGYVFTPIVERQIPDQMKVHNMTREEVIQNVFLKEHAVKEFITVEAIAESVLFLTDSAAASVTTGIALSVDAGWTAH